MTFWDEQLLMFNITSAKHESNSCAFSKGTMLYQTDQMKLIHVDSLNELKPTDFRHYDEYWHQERLQKQLIVHKYLIQMLPIL